MTGPVTWYNAERVAKKHSVILAQWNATQSPTARRKITELRKFEAAQNSRLNFGWNTVNSKIDSELRSDLASLRARSRDLSINNDYARKFLDMVSANVVGPNGFTLQSQVSDPNGASDTLARRAIEDAFWLWGRAGNCETSGKLAFNDFCRLYIRTVARDGEALVRVVRDRRFDFGIKLQLLDIDRLDITYNEKLSSGNMVRMGVELDSFGGPVAYWLLSRHPGEYMAGDNATGTRERIPAAEVFHCFVPDRPEQTRGFPWMSTAMQRMNMLHGYEEAAVTAARNGASKMGFFTSPDGSARDLSDGTDDQGNFTTMAEPGTFDVIPQGYTFQQYNPEYPTQNYDSFVKSCLRGIASGLGVAYNTLANDLEGVNFSSIRSGTLSERENYMVMQNWMIETFLRPFFMQWLESALIKGACVMPNGSALPARNLQKFSAHAWQGRRWQWVDPEKDINASLLAIRGGLSTPQIVAAQMGLDIEDVIDALKQANTLAQGAGLPAYCSIPPAAPAPSASNDATVKAAQVVADANLRMAELYRESLRSAPEHPPVNINVAPPSVNVAPAQVNVGASREDIEEINSRMLDRLDAAVTKATDMPINVVVNVPEQAAPTVNVNVEPTPVTLEATIQPAEVSLAMPDRKTVTTVTRDSNGDMSGSVAVETDA